MTKQLKTHDIFALDREIQADLRSYIQKVFLYPFFWTDSTKHIPPTPWQAIPFEDSQLPNVPNTPGVYAFQIVPPIPNNFIDSSYLMYIGKAERSLRGRFKDYMNERDGIGKGKNKPRFLVQEFLSDYNGYVIFKYCTLTKMDVPFVEERLLNTYVPYVNARIPEATISRELQYLYR